MRDVRKLGLRKLIALEAIRKRRHILAETHPLRTLFWESTHRCNVSCLHCGSDCKADSNMPDMPADDFLRVIDSILSKVDPHCLLVIISGGEPLVRVDLEHVGLELYRREMPWGIVTNGLALTESRLLSLRKSGLRTISVSVDGLEAEHNWLRNHHASFDKAIRAINYIAQCPELEWDVITCVNQRNLPTLPILKERLIEAGVKNWRLFTIFPAGRAAKIEDLKLSTEQYRQMLDFIVDTRREGRIKASHGCEGFLGSYENEVRDGFYQCNAGLTVGSILIDGSISACASIRSDFYQGNIYSDDFMDVWENRFQAYRNRDWMKTGACAECSFWRYCEGNGMHLHTSDGGLMRCNLQGL